MGMYVNIGNAGFRSIRKGLYVDKSGLIAFINRTLGTKDKLTCVSRPRRFGKSFATQMLCAYYDRNCDSRELFSDLEIAKDKTFEENLNKFDVIYLDITWFISTVKNIKDTVSYLQDQVIQELCSIYSFAGEEHSLPIVLAKIAETAGCKFIIIIDEWDALFREAKDDTDLQKEYIQLLRGLFKSSLTDKMIEAAYMTGILPIKKYGTQSALTDFREYTMIQPKKLAKYVGFTEKEVKDLCRENDMDFEEARRWYDGYSFSKEHSVYSPNSVIQAISNEEWGDYWTETETYESLKYYIGMNEDGLKDAIISMLGGVRCKINTRTFQNDMSNLKSRDDVLTLLVHLGYLAYDSTQKEVYIPNQEVADEFRNAVEYSGWEGVSAALQASESLLEATIRGDAETVAKGIDEVHSANTSVLAYNSEQALSCVITIAYYVARKDYTLIRELPAGKGFADIAFLPRKHTNKPALIVELKWDKSAQGAICQIKDKQYVGALEEYADNLLMVGINYDKTNKKHECIIEKYEYCAD
ncbi:MAG: AAA family ATPase [Lachnospiraceae bacterium]|nr:AAA family ATPase [Lachnospiraceae bacterium]